MVSLPSKEGCKRRDSLERDAGRGRGCIAITIFYPQQIRIKNIGSDFKTADISTGVKEIHAFAGAIEEQTAHKNVSKQLARERAEVDGYNPTMVDSLEGVFGGYGWHQLENIPIPKVLTRWEKRQLSKAEGLYQKGILEPLYRLYGTTNLEIVKKVIIAKAKGIPRETIQTRRGARLIPSKPSGLTAVPMASLEGGKS